MAKIEPTAGPRLTVKRMFWVIIACVLLSVVLDTVAQLLPPYYSPVSEPESFLAVGPYGYMMTLNFVNRGILSIIFVYAFLRAMSLKGAKTNQYRLGVSLLAVWGIGALLLAAFPADLSSTPVTWQGAIHSGVAVLVFVGGAFGSLALSLKLAQDASVAGAARFATPVSVVAVLLLLAQFVLPGVAPALATRFYGLLERAFIGTVLLWIFAMSVYLGTNAKSDEKSASP